MFSLLFRKTPFPLISTIQSHQYYHYHYYRQILLKDCKLEETSPEIILFRAKAAEHFPVSVAFGTPVESMIDT